MFTYVRTEVNYTEEVDDPVDSDGKQKSLFHFLYMCSHCFLLHGLVSLDHSCLFVKILISWLMVFAGEVLGFENLVFSIFEFVHTLLENNKFKSTVKKALPELIYYIILYMQITEDQVRNNCSTCG